MTVLLLAAFAASALAAARLTVLVKEDSLTAPLRNRLLARLALGPRRRRQHLTPDQISTALRRPPLAAELLTCRWCIGFWAALVCSIATRHLLTVPVPHLSAGLPWGTADYLVVPLWTFAAAYLVGVLPGKD